MLIEFAVKNFRSFRDEQRLSLIAGRDQRHAETLIDHQDSKVLRVAAIYGANASGKSNFYRAFAVARRFICESATRMNAGDKLRGIEPFLFDGDSSTLPTEFEFVFELNGLSFTYGFAATSTRVTAEWLLHRTEPHETSKPRKTRSTVARWFERTYHSASERYEWKYSSGSPLTSDDRKLLQERTRDNGLALSRGADLNVEALDRIYLWFKGEVITIDMSRFPSGLVERTATRLAETPSLKKKLVTLLQEADLQVVDYELESNAGSPVDHPEIKEMLTDKALQLLRDASQYKVRLVHEVAGEKKIPLDIEDESRGTQRLFAIAGPVIETIARGGILFVDELDCSLHPLLTRKLVELFQTATTNAQIVFNTHDTTLMESDLFRRDQLWFIEKDATQASSLYSLHDVQSKKVRSSENFERNYLAGRYGGVPHFGYKLSSIFGVERDATDAVESDKTADATAAALNRKN